MKKKVDWKLIFNLEDLIIQFYSFLQVNLNFGRFLKKNIKKRLNFQKKDFKK